MTPRRRYFSADVLVEILLRLPPSSRRRARLVCRYWRDVVNERTMEMQSRPKVLLWNIDYAVAYVSDNLSSPSTTGNCTRIWKTSDPLRHREKGMQLVGSCNGLLCLCDNSLLGGSITLFNPATGETLAVPSLRCVGHHGQQNSGDKYSSSYTLQVWVSNGPRWGDRYSFAYHPITAQYKLVHVPGSYVVHVLALGEATWWEVTVGIGGVNCDLAANIISVDGTTYWVRVTGAGAAKVVSFDLMNERVTSITTPVPIRCDHYHLTEVHGRLGFVASSNVWVLEEEQRWRHRYKFGECIPRRYFVYGECVLTCKGLSYYSHRLKGTPLARTCDQVALVGHQDEGVLVATMHKHSNFFDENYETFPYVETIEPLGVYETN